MRNANRWAAAVAALVLVGCGGSPRGHEAVMKDTLDAMEAFADTLGKIRSKADLEKFRGDLEAISKKMDALKKEADALGEPPKELDAQLKAKYADRMQRIVGKLFAAMMGLPPDVQKEIDKMGIMRPGPAPAAPPA